MTYTCLVEYCVMELSKINNNDAVGEVKPEREGNWAL